MNKVFSAGQRKDKDLSTGRYAHPPQDQTNHFSNRRIPLPLVALCLIILALAALAVILL